MSEIELDVEKKQVEEFLREVVRTYPKATYGEKMIRMALDKGAVDTLLLSEELRKRTSELKCNSCNHEWKISLSRTDPLPICPECDTESDNITELSEIDIIDELSKLAQNSSSKVALISTDTEEGATLFNGFGGMAAILRYSIG